MKTSLLAFAALLALAALAAPAPSLAQSVPNGIPIVRVDKSRFASGEAVFFWVGVRAVNHGSIPKAYWNSCRLTITRPDGTKETRTVGWPIDGMVDRGWEGGSGLFEKPKPGTYEVSFEFAGQRSTPVSLVVGNLPILKQIKTDFVFGQASTSGTAQDTSVTFVVTSASDQTICFSHRDGVNGLVWVSLRKADRSYGSDFFYPAKALLDKDEPSLPNQSYENFTWEMARKVPTITLAPGKTYRQKLSLSAAFRENALGMTPMPGRYSVTFGTNLQVLIGEPNSAIAAFSPVHIPVTGTTAYTLAPQSASQH